METNTNLRAALCGLVLAAVVVVMNACGGNGACVQTHDDGKTFTCIETTKSVCGQGKGDKWVGGACQEAGYTKKIANTENGWEK
jgi:hypothetical protein